jgi:hypothetical protein
MVFMGVEEEKMKEERGRKGKRERRKSKHRE